MRMYEDTSLYQEAATMTRRAADIIAERGLAKGSFQDPQGRVCHDGAVGLAICGDALLARPSAAVAASGSPLALLDNPTAFWSAPRRHKELMLVIWEASAAVLRKRGHPASAWLFNDQDSTTAEDVILLLKETAVWLEEAS